MRACRPLVVVVLVLAASAVSAETKPDWMGKIRSGHPRIFFNRDTWPAVAARAKASGTPENVQLGFLLKAADAVPLSNSRRSVRTAAVAAKTKPPRKIAETPASRAIRVASPN